MPPVKNSCYYLDMQVKATADPNPPTDEIIESLLAYAAEQIAIAYPEYAGSSCSWLRHGTQRFAVIVNDSLVALIPLPGKTGAGLAIGAEAALLRLIHDKLPLAVPQCIPISATCDPTSAAKVILYPMLPGKVLEHCQAEVIDVTQVCRSLGGFLHALHSIPLQQAKLLELPLEQESIDEALAFCRKRIPRAVNSLRGILPESMTRLAAAAFKEPPPSPVGKSCLVHNDLQPANILYDEQRHELVGMLDWEKASISDPAIDLGALWQFFGEAGLQACTETYVDLADTNLAARARFHGRFQFVSGISHYLSHIQGLERQQALNYITTKLAPRASRWHHLDDMIAQLRQDHIL